MEDPQDGEKGMSSFLRFPPHLPTIFLGQCGLQRKKPLRILLKADLEAVMRHLDACAAIVSLRVFRVNPKIGRCLWSTHTIRERRAQAR